MPGGSRSPGGSGGKGRGVAEGLLDQQGRQQFAVQPRLGADGVALRQMAQPGQRLEALEHELHLPAQAVPVQNGRRTELGFRERGEDDHVLGVLQRLWAQPHLLARRPTPQLGDRQARRGAGLADGAHPSRHRLAAVDRHRRRPAADIAGPLQRRHRPAQVERLPVRFAQPQRLGVLRWQVELVFKRSKSLAGLGHLPKRNPVSARAWLCGKLLVALLVEKAVRHASAVSFRASAGAVDGVISSSRSIRCSASSNPCFRSLKCSSSGPKSLACWPTRRASALLKLPITFKNYKK